MDRALPFIIGTVATVSGLALAVMVFLAWQPCAGVGLPVTGETAPACAAIAHAAPTGWVGALWPFALIATLYAAFRAVATHWTAGTIAAVPVLVLLAIAEPRRRVDAAGPPSDDGRRAAVDGIAHGTRAAARRAADLVDRAAPRRDAPARCPARAARASLSAGPDVSRRGARTPRARRRPRGRRR